MDTLQEILDQLIKFRDERDWKRFHTPKNLDISLAIEVGELLEEFQWKDDHEISEYIEERGFESVREELADIMIYLLLLSNEIGINLMEAVKEKIKKNEEKYPVEKSKGTAKKYTEL